MTMWEVRPDIVGSHPDKRKINVQAQSFLVESHYIFMLDLCVGVAISALLLGGNLVDFTNKDFFRDGEACILKEAQVSCCLWQLAYCLGRNQVRRRPAKGTAEGETET